MEQVGIDLRVQGRASAQQDLQAVQRDLDGLGHGLRDLDEDSARAAREFDQAMDNFREASRTMEGRVGRDLDEVSRDLRDLSTDADRAARDISTAFDEIGGVGGAGGLVERMGLSPGMFAGAGAAAGSAFVLAMTEGLQRDAQADLAAASFGIFDVRDRAEFDQAIRDLYQDMWADSPEAAGRALAAAGQATFGLDLDMAALQAATEDALALSSVFAGANPDDILLGAANLAKTTGTDIAEVFDQIAAAVDGVNGVFRQDFFDVLGEYSARLDEMSLSSEQFLAVLGAASGTGAYNLDVVADSLAEMMNVIQEGGKPAQDALRRLGLDAKQILIDINADGPQALQAFDQVLAALQRADDVTRSQTAADLGGGPLENLGLGREGIEVLRAFNDGLEDVTGSMEQLKDASADNVWNRWGSRWRGLQDLAYDGATAWAETAESMVFITDSMTLRTSQSLRDTEDALTEARTVADQFGVDWSGMFTNMADVAENSASRIAGAVQTIMNPFGGGTPRTGGSVRDGLTDGRTSGWDPGRATSWDLPDVSPHDSWGRGSPVEVNVNVSAVDAEGVANFFGHYRTVLAEEVARAVEQAQVTGGAN